MPEEEYQSRIVALMGQTSETMGDALSAWRQLEYQAEALKQESERIAAKRQRVNKNIERIKGAMVAVVKAAGGRLQVATDVITLGRSKETARIADGFPVLETFGKPKTEWVLDQDKAKAFIANNPTEAQRSGLSLGSTVYPVRR